MNSEMKKSENGTAYILVYDDKLNLYPFGGDSFVNWLLAEGFTVHETYHGTYDYCPAVYVNINNKKIAFGKPGIKCFEHLGNHAVTTDEFKTVYYIFKKYEGKDPFVFN